MKIVQPEEIAERLVPFLEKEGLLTGSPDISWLTRLVMTLRERAVTLVEMAQKAEFYFRELDYEPEPAEKFLTSDIDPLMAKASAFISAVQPFDHETLHTGIRGWLEEEGVKLKLLAQPLRIALTYRKDSPGLFEVMEVLGKEKTLERIERAREWIKIRSQ
jgi:glutamyl-tRNA synthetase